MDKFTHPLELRKGEWQCIRDALAAQSLVENGHFLPSPGRQTSAKRMIERGFLSQADAIQFHGDRAAMIIVKITPENINAYNAALAKAELEMDERDEEVRT